MKKSKIVITIFLLILLVFSLGSNNFFVIAQDGDILQHYIIYDEQNNYLFEKAEVLIGDNYVSKEYKMYEVTLLNEQLKTGIAKFIKQLKKPKVSISAVPSPISTTGKHIGLYCSHNDESYEPTDGYYTIYGKGGIHDVANELKTTFQNSGVTTTFDETLHIPHDYLAYSRSSVTANRLLNENTLNALFDIHRDGISRSFYATTVNGQERSKIRIVVGKANPNKEVNEDFALYISAVADEMFPWLISDIYYATGHYNQGLFEKALLFEMGTYLIEKELVLSSIDPLVQVINTVLFNTTVDPSTGELEIGGTPTETNPLVDDALNNESYGLKTNNAYSYIIYVSLVLFVMFFLIKVFIMLYEKFVLKKHRKN